MSDESSGEPSTTESAYPPLVEDIMGILPKLIDRTSAQLQFSQTVLSMLPCTRNLVSGQRIDDGEVPAHEAPQPADVLTILEDESSASDAADDPLSQAGAPSDIQGHGTGSENGNALAGEPVPAMVDLAIPEYDSLAASQVVPRLTTLDAGELVAIGAYETANRARRTILNRVTALLAG